MRRAFTLIELLVVIGIMGTMVTVGIVGIRAGKSRSQLAGATRDVLALMRQARAIALITQKPSVITYSNEQIEDENNAKIVVKSEKLFDSSENEKRVVKTLAGDVVDENGKVEEWERWTGEKNGEVIQSVVGEKGTSQGEVADEAKGETLNDIFTAPIALDITKGLKLKVEKGEDQTVSASSDGKVYKSAISVFSTTEYVTSKYSEKQNSSSGSSSGSSSSSGLSSNGESVEDAMTEPVSVVWQTNGRTEPHTVWIYPEGTTPDRGLSIVVDKFGDCKVSQWQEDEK